jgi:hypothetical protein
MEQMAKTLLLGEVVAPADMQESAALVAQEGALHFIQAATLVQHLVVQ